MADGDSTFAIRYHKPIASVGVGSRKTRTQQDSDVAQWVVVTGVPTAALPDGSIATRDDATDGDDALYVRVAGAWVPILGATA